MCKKYFIAFIVLITQNVFILSSHAQAEPTVPKTKVKYIIGVSYLNGFPLFSHTEIDDKGIAWVILQKFAESQNIEFEYVAMPITRLQPSMDIGAIDFIFPDNPLWSSFRSNRQPNIFSGVLLSAIGATFVRTENKDMTLAQLNKVAIPFGYSANTWIDPINTYNIQSVPVRDLYTALFSVIQGTVEAADVEYNIGQYLIDQNPSFSGLSIAPNLPSASVNYHLSSIKHITILEKLSVFVEEEQAFIQQLNKDYNIKEYHEVYPQIVR